MNKLVIIFLVLVVVAGAILYWGNTDTEGPQMSSDGPLKIGVLLPLTGDAALYGESENRGVIVAVDEINAAGGIGGRQIELVTEDGKCDPQIAGTAAQKLVNIDQVSIIIGGACSGETLAAAEITEPAGVILISPSATSPAITDVGEYLFRTIPSDSLSGQIAATYARGELETGKAALLTELTDYAQGLREVFKDSFTGQGGEIVADETYNTGDADFRTQVLKIKAAAPDVVYVVPQSPTSGVTIFRQLRENGVTAVFMTAEALLDRQTVADNAATLEGMYGVEAVVDWENNPKAQAFQSAHQSMFGEDPGIFAANAYDAVYLIKEAIESDGDDTGAIKDFLYNVSGWPGVIGDITFDSNGDAVMGASVGQVKDGQVVNIGTFEP